MKKNVFLIIGLLVSNYVCADEPVYELEICEEQEDVMIDRCENSDEFEDFFGEEDENNETPRQEKPKLSRVQLAMMHLGVAVALRVESCCNGVRSLYRYVKSWVIREN